MVNLELYRVFYVVAMTGSLTKAANELFISQPAVSQAIKQLEGQVGGQLFVRTPKGMKLTGEGNMMLAYVSQAMTLLSEAQDKFNQMTKSAVGTVRIGASDTLCKHFLLKHIVKFRKTYGEINIKVTNRTSEESLELLKNGSVDIAFVNMPMDVGAELEAEVCHEIHDCFVAGLGFEHLKGRQVKLQELSDYPLLLLEHLSNSRKAVGDFTKTMGITLSPEIELGSMDLLADFAANGLGIACMPREYVTEQLESGKIFELDVAPELPTRSVALIMPKKGYTNFAVKEFVKQIKTANI